jgi:peptide/nickel transport system substrate-binding protein
LVKRGVSALPPVEEEDEMQSMLRSAVRRRTRFNLLVLALASVIMSAFAGVAVAMQSTSHSSGSTVTILSSAAPDSVDPQVGLTGQAREAIWVVNTPLLTFRHANGIAGTEVIAGLASALPKISNGGLTYKLTLRKALRYSNGMPVRASDFTLAIERALRLNWPEDFYFTSYIRGASDFLAKKAKGISGITTNNATGAITIQLTTPNGSFPAILALPAAAPVPADTPMKPLNTHPPAGDGPYMFKSVTPNGGFTLVKNPSYKPLPGIAAGHLDTIKLVVNTNVQAAAEQVLSNKADVFDANNPVPPLLLQQVHSRAASRFTSEPSPDTSFFFFNVSEKPFSSLKARQAVLTAIDERAFARFASGLIQVDCYLTPSTIPGHPSAPCPYHGPNQTPDTTAAKQLVQESGMVGEPVTVFSESSSPRDAYANYLVQVLNEIGFNATPKLLTPSIYYSTIGNPDTKAQVGFVNWAVDYPNPAGMWLPFQQASGPSLDYGAVNDPQINALVPRLSAQPLTKGAAKGWAALDVYGVKQAYYAAFGHNDYVKFFSNRLNFKAAVFSPLFQNDYASLELK